MGIKDKLSSAVNQVAVEAEKAVEQGRYKVEELQLERQMDQAARKLGYLEYDAHASGSGVDQERRQELLQELADLDGQITQAREETAARKRAKEQDAQETEAEKDVGFDDSAIGPEEVTGIELAEDAEQRLEGEEEQERPQG